jgi:hypothetical protein
MKSRTYNVATEHQEQRQLFTWSILSRQKYPQLLNMFAIPNGGWRHKTTAAKLKAEGVKAGVPDIFLAWPSQGYNGLFIEMKRMAGSSLSDNQKIWGERLFAAGYQVRVCKGFEEAKQAIEEYLND